MLNGSSQWLYIRKKPRDISSIGISDTCLQYIYIYILWRGGRITRQGELNKYPGGWIYSQTRWVEVKVCWLRCSGALQVCSGAWWIVLCFGQGWIGHACFWNKRRGRTLVLIILEIRFSPFPGLTRLIWPWANEPQVWPIQPWWAGAGDSCLSPGQRWWVLGTLVTLPPPPPPPP